jgi:hypothetical protein
MIMQLMMRPYCEERLQGRLESKEETTETTEMTEMAEMAATAAKVYHSVIVAPRTQTATDATSFYHSEEYNAGIDGKPLHS